MTLSAAAYRRDAPTWTGYGLIGVWAFFLYFIGPASGTIADSLGLGDTAAGFISTALAAGLICAAFAGPLLMRRLGRIRTLLIVLTAMSTLTIVLALSPWYALVLLAVAGLGMTGVTVANSATATLSDRHPHHRARALTEANAAAAWLGVLSPVVLGFFLALPSGWRGAAVVVALVPLIALLPARRLPEPAPPVAGELVADTGRFNPYFWPALVTVSMAVALEFSVNFWAASLIRERTGADAAAAATALAAMTFGIALGRTFAAGLPNRIPVPNLLVVFFLFTCAGLGVLLSAGTLALSLAGLFMTGCGLSVLFPFAQSQAISLGLDRIDRAVALTSLAVGLAIGIAPFILGVLAEAFSLELAFSAGFVLAAVGIASTLIVAAGRHR